MPDFIFAFLFGLIVGGGAAWLIARARYAGADQLANKFKALAADTLRANNESFLQLAESRLKQSEQAAATELNKKAVAIDEMVKPVKESLQKMGDHLQALEAKREGAYHDVLRAVQASNETQQYLRHETSQLLQALHSSTTRGAWCQIQLKRIFELAGMAEHLRDFTSQQTLTIDDGVLRPDYVVSLSGGRNVIFDCKVPLTAYLEYTKNREEPARKDLLARHAKLVRDHIRALGSKEYWSHMDSSPEFVVMFLPENLLGAALDTDPELLDYGIRQKIVLATQTTVLAVLWSVAYGWKEEALRDNVKKIGALGNELHTSLAALIGHITALGGKLKGALDSYNNMIGSFDRNVLSKARKLRDFGAAKDTKALPETLDLIDGPVRALTDIEPPANEDAA